MRRGLVVGKFMPLHRGHQVLIEAALADSDDVTVVVYDSQPPGEYPPMPVELRLRWLRELYPAAESILALPDPLSSDDPRDAGFYADGLRFLGPFDRFYSSEPAYGRFAQLLGAEHVVVDAARAAVPISGTRIREDPYAHRGWLDPAVYASLVRKVVCVGTESAGKTTLARALAARHGTLWAHEYGRELWVAQDLSGSFADHLRIATRQHAREEAARRQARRFLFCDTNAWTTLMWSLWTYGVADARLHELVDRTVGDYEWLLCDADIPWEDDGTRELRDGAAARFHAFQVADLERRSIPYRRISGTLDERLEAVDAVLGLRPVAA